MRSALRISLAGIVVFCLVSLSLLWMHRDDWKQHLHDVSHYRPYSRPSSDTNPYASKDLPEHFEEAAALSGEEYLPSAPTVSPSTSSTEISATSLETSTPTKPASYAKAVVMAKTEKEDTSWVSELSSWEPYVYSVDNTSARLHTPKNKGREAMAYLTYIIENYENLASTVAFVHSHKEGYPKAWHTDNEQFSNVLSLSTLRTEWIQESGYANLRCNAALGCDPPEIQPNRWPKEAHRTSELEMPEAWKAIFGPEVPLPTAIGEACCAQFAVSKTQILKRTRSEYERYRDWLLHTELSDDIAGRIIEYLWHIIFGQEPVFCPDTYTCYCKLYGYCA